MSLRRNKNRDSLGQCVFDCGQVTKNNALWQKKMMISTIMIAITIITITMIMKMIIIVIIDDDDKTTTDYCSMIRSSKDEIRAEKTWGCLLSLRLRLFLRCEFVLSTAPFLFASCFLLLFKHVKDDLNTCIVKKKIYTYPWESSAASKQTINPNWCYCSSQREGNWTKILNHWPDHTLYFRISIFKEWKCKHNFSLDFTGKSQYFTFEQGIYIVWVLGSNTGFFNVVQATLKLGV